MPPATPGPRVSLRLPGTALTHQITLLACIAFSVPLVHHEFVQFPWLFWSGLVLVLGVTVAVLVVALPATRAALDPARATTLAATAAVLSMMGIALLRWAGPDGLGYVAFLMALPGVWLASLLHFRGAAIAIVVAVLTQFVGPVGMGSLPTEPVLVRGVSSVVVVGAVALLVAQLVRQRDSQQRRLALVTTALGVVHGALGPDGHLTNVSGRLAGPARHLPIDQVLHQPLLAENGRDELPADQYPLRRAREGHEFVGKVVWTTVTKGRKVALSVSASPVDGTMLVVVHDVTASLSAVLQEEQFLANVSHELKTPLTSIAGYLELLEDDAREAPNGTLDAAVVLRRLEVVGRNVVRLQRLILGLLETARTLHSSVRNGDPCVMDFAMLVREQVESMRPRAESQRLSWQVSGLEEPLPLGNADSVQLGQAVDNLLSNAVKYSRPGGVVEVQLTSDRQSVTLTVRDHGIGVGADDLPKLFTPYFRARTALDSGTEGTGIGLLVTRRIAHAHGGELEVESAEGEGTTVILTVPLQRT